MGTAAKFPVHDCKAHRRAPALLIRRALRAGAKSSVLSFCLGVHRGGELLRDRFFFGVKLRGDPGTTFGGFTTANFPPMGLIADRARMGCLRMIR